MRNFAKFQNEAALFVLFVFNGLSWFVRISSY